MQRHPPPLPSLSFTKSNWYLLSSGTLSSIKSHASIGPLWLAWCNDVFPLESWAIISSCLYSGHFIIVTLILSAVIQFRINFITATQQSELTSAVFRSARTRIQISFTNVYTACVISVLYKSGCEAKQKSHQPIMWVEKFSSATSK